MTYPKNGFDHVSAHIVEAHREARMQRSFERTCWGWSLFVFVFVLAFF